MVHCGALRCVWVCYGLLCYGVLCYGVLYDGGCVMV